jgi:hypothetical protein
MKTSGTPRYMTIVYVLVLTFALEMWMLGVFFVFKCNIGFLVASHMYGNPLCLKRCQMHNGIIYDVLWVTMLVVV